LHVFFEPRIALGAWDTGMNKAKIPAFRELPFHPGNLDKAYKK
jgi:hypothetical protein